MSEESKFTVNGEEVSAITVAWVKEGDQDVLLELERHGEDEFRLNISREVPGSGIVVKFERTSINLKRKHLENLAKFADRLAFPTDEN